MLEALRVEHGSRYPPVRHLDLELIHRKLFQRIEAHLKAGTQIHVNELVRLREPSFRAER